MRQSDALFQHVKQLPEQFEKLEQGGWHQDIRAVGASTRPRAVEGSYMPLLSGGASQGQSLARTLGVPFFPHSHQQGHLAAGGPGPPGIWSCWTGPFWPGTSSGGTTELLLGPARRDHRPGRDIGRDGRHLRRAAH